MLWLLVACGAPKPLPAEPAIVDARTLEPARRALADSTTAAIGGHVYDRAHHEFVAGAYVVVTSPALPRGSLAAVSDDNGDYVVSDMPPGTYAVTLYYADVTTGVRNLDVVAGYAARVDLSVDRAVRARGEPLHAR
jgi:hypothetical protein